MKVIFLIPRFDRGGPPRVVSELSLRFPESVESIIVLYENKITYPYKGKLYSLNIPSSLNPLIKLKSVILGVKRFKKILKVEKPDAVVSFLEGPNLLNILTFSAPVISVRNSFKERYYMKKRLFRFIYSAIIKNMYPRAKKIVAVSEGIKNELIKRFDINPDKIIVVYNPCNIERIQKLSKEALPSEYEAIFESPVIISVGRLTMQKGQWHLIRVFKEIKAVFPDLKLVILGEGNLREYLEDLIGALELREDVFLVGHHENPFKFMARSKLFVFPSLWEGFGNVLIEAMACRIPIIASDYRSGGREILAPDTDIEYETRETEYAKHGVLVPVCDGVFYNAEDLLIREEKILINSIIEMLKDNKRMDRYVKNGLERVKDFDIGIINERYLEILNKM